ncbi:MAG: hypothetical protein IPN67_21300 [Bacteroidales bacterium]|nr:hypothetical protein [Bacteroidales bacterium]
MFDNQMVGCSVRGTKVGTGSSFATPSLSSTRTYWASCVTGGPNDCQSQRTPAVASIGAPPSLGNITGPASVCTGQTNIQYSVPFYAGTYNWSFSGSGATINTTANPNIITISFSVATTGTLSVTDVTSCGSSAANNLVITVGTITPPTIGTITQPSCSTPTGSVQLNGLPAGTWTITRSPVEQRIQVPAQVIQLQDLQPEHILLL